MLMERKAEVTICNNMGITPLMYAVRKGNSPLVELLLLHGARINRTDLDGTFANPLESEARTPWGMRPLACLHLLRRRDLRDPR